MLSATNLTRIAIRFGGMALSAGLVHALLGGTLLEVPIIALAVGAVDQGSARLWKRIGGSVQRAWNAVAIAIVLLLTAGLVIHQLAPDSTLARGVQGWVGGLVESQRAAMDRRTRARRIPVDSSVAISDRWRILVDSGAARQGTYWEATAWCAALGPGWRLPPGFGAWPDLPSYPDVGTIFHVWSSGGSGLQIGDGQKPAAAVTGSHRDTEVRGVLCLNGGG